MKYPTPTEPGLYLARASNYKWWNYVVSVYGEAPFLQFLSWDRVSSITKNEFDKSGIEWGPKIDEPEVK
jgi:hypothetical protein